MEEYGIQPFFKARMNAGMITVTEVGKYKKEIAYHGDTINTAARIKGKCNTFGQKLLITESLKNQPNKAGYVFKELGSIPLRGMELKAPIFSAFGATTAIIPISVFQQLPRMENASPLRVPQVV